MQILSTEYRPDAEASTSKRFACLQSHEKLGVARGRGPHDFLGRRVIHWASISLLGKAPL